MTRLIEKKTGPAKLIFMAALQWRLGKMDDKSFRAAVATILANAVENVVLDSEHWRDTGRRSGPE